MREVGTVLDISATDMGRMELPPPTLALANAILSVRSHEIREVGALKHAGIHDCCCLRWKGCHSAASVVRHAMAQGTSLGTVIAWPAQLARPIARSTRVNRANRVFWSQEGDHVGVYGFCSSEQRYSLV